VPSLPLSDGGRQSGSTSGRGEVEYPASTAFAEPITHMHAHIAQIFCFNPSRGGLSEFSGLRHFPVL
jgi:hypothetical protein